MLTRPLVLLQNCDFCGSYVQCGVETPLTKKKKFLTMQLQIELSQGRIFTFKYNVFFKAC